MATAKITIRGVRKAYQEGRVVALADVDLDVAENEVLCIVGPSGCGKTTLLRALNGLIIPDAGSVLVDGEEVRGPNRHAAMVFQHFGLFPWKTVYQNIAYGLTLQRKPRADIDSVVRRYIELVGLTGFEKSYPYQLSGGMRQRVGLARALAVNPGVLLMDEPFAALDAQTREFLQEELARIWVTERKTVVFITHSIDEAVFLGDRVAIMSARPGRVREILTVGIPRPRDMISAKSNPRYIELRNYIWKQLKGGDGDGDALRDASGA